MTLNLRLPINGKINVRNSGRPIKQTPVEGEKPLWDRWGKKRDAASPNGLDDGPDPITDAELLLIGWDRATLFTPKGGRAPQPQLQLTKARSWLNASRPLLVRLSPYNLSWYILPQDPYPCMIFPLKELSLYSGVHKLIEMTESYFS